MGELYRARDQRLNRDVAIKLSNLEFTERFTREARTIAALNHTNICHLYDVASNYLVMEYVEGETLRGPMSLRDALPILRQICTGSRPTARSRRRGSSIGPGTSSRSRSGRMGACCSWNSRCRPAA